MSTCNETHTHIHEEQEEEDDEGEKSLRDDESLIIVMTHPREGDTDRRDACLT